ncbi:MAG: histidine kinase, partial [Clostridia bacterium]|nr:histidine kinase [Clostridia bacterium]
MSKRFSIACLVFVWVAAAVLPLLGTNYYKNQTVGSALEQAKTQAELAAEQLAANINLAVADKQAALAPALQRLLKTQTPEEFAAAAQNLQALLPSVAGSGITRIRVYHSGVFGDSENIYGAVLPVSELSNLQQEQRIRTAESGPILLCDPMHYVFYMDDDADRQVFVLMELDYDVIALRIGSRIAIIAGEKAFYFGEPFVYDIADQPIAYAALPDLDARIAVFVGANVAAAAPLWQISFTLASLITVLLTMALINTARTRKHLAAAIRQILSIEEAGKESIEDLLAALFEKLENQKKETDINRRLHREAELNAMQMRLNPHLLYNALSTVSWMAMEAGQEQLVEIVNQLARFYRTSLAEAGQTSTVQETVEQIRDYLAIYKIAMDAFFDAEIDVPDDTLGIHILHLLLQPLVENAVVHGLEPRPGGMLWLKFSLQGDMLHITIEDNGTGMSKKSEHGLGLRLVQSRLRFYYGDR